MDLPVAGSLVPIGTLTFMQVLGIQTQVVTDKHITELTLFPAHIVGFLNTLILALKNKNKMGTPSYISIMVHNC